MSRETVIALLYTMPYLYFIVNGLYGVNYIVHNDELTVGKFFEIAFFGTLFLFVDTLFKIIDTINKWAGGDPPAWWTHTMSKRIYVRRRNEK
jgi:hypothetical protein